MFEAYRQLWMLLDRRERQQAVALTCLFVISGFVDAAGIASILPFLAVLADPDLVTRNAILVSAQEALGTTTHQQFLLVLGVASLVFVVFGQAVKAGTHYVTIRFALMREYSICSRMLAGYLHQPYHWFLNRHSADLSTAVLSEVSRVVNDALSPALKVLSQTAVVLFVVALLVLLDPLAAVLAAAVVGGSYLLIFVSIRHRLLGLGRDVVEANHRRFGIVQEGFAGIKDVKLRRLEHAYIGRFRDPAARYARGRTASELLADLPRFVLEAVAFGGMLLVVLVVLWTQGGAVQGALPVIGVYAFAGVRLFPAMQLLYRSFSRLRFTQPALAALHADADLAVAGPQPPTGGRAMQLTEALTLEAIRYRYPGATRPALTALDLVIPARNTVGLVGSTGSGKTTTVDLILGLLLPEAGTVKVDGRPLDNASLPVWQASIGYVPQEIYLTDNSIAANIAFGVPVEQIDMAAVERAARMAELHDFVLAELPHGYDTEIGERGVRLSGGQRQRIGIARALYHDPAVLILDEATSALDNLTESAVMDAVRNLGHRKTIIIVAHRLSTVRSCDVIYLLEAGRCVAHGSYDELLHGSDRFRALAQAAA